MQQPNPFFPQTNKPITLNDLAILTTSVETLFEQLHRSIEAQFQDIRNIILSSGQDRVHMPNTVAPGSGKNPILSAVPPTLNSQQPTLLFTPETKRVFLRTALSRELFERLKRVSKRWLANVPEEQRRQATKVAQAIAKAVTEGRISLITSEHLENYKARIRQATGQNFDIPPEQISAALSQKIRIYLQNTKSKHDKWVKCYEGKVALNAPIIHIPADSDDESIEAEELTPNKVKPELLLPPAVDDDELLNSMIRKRDPIQDLSADRKSKKDAGTLSSKLTKPEVEKLLPRAKTLIFSDWEALNNTTDHPERGNNPQHNYKESVIILSLWLNESGISRRWNFPNYLQAGYGIFLDYCVDKQVYNLSLDNMEGLLFRTMLRMLAICLTTGKSIQQTQNCLLDFLSTDDPKIIIQWLENNFESAMLYVEKIVLSVFYDFGSAFGFNVSEDIIPSAEHPSVIDYLEKILLINFYPNFSPLQQLIVLLMFSRDNVDLSDINISPLTGLKNLSTVVLGDMLNVTPLVQVQHIVDKSLVGLLKSQWKFFN